MLHDLCLCLHMNVLFDVATFRFHFFSCLICSLKLAYTVFNWMINFIHLFNIPPQLHMRDLHMPTIHNTLIDVYFLMLIPNTTSK